MCSTYLYIKKKKNKDKTSNRPGCVYTLRAITLNKTKKNKLNKKSKNTLLSASMHALSVIHQACRKRIFYNI